MKNLSVVIPAYNCQAILDNTLFYLRGRADREDVEIIVVDDGSYVPIICPSGVTLIRHHDNKGVGAAFDTGVKTCSNEYIVLMGADIIVLNSWDTTAIRILDQRPLSMICTICSGFGDSQLAFRPDRALRYGAHILKYHEVFMENHVQSDILQAQWNRSEPQWDDHGMAEVGCILGAFYLTTKTVYNAIGGWMGHRIWGGLEPMISIRARRSGYKLYVTNEIETAHNFGRVPKTEERPARWDMILYNKMLMAHTMFEDPTEMIELLYTRGINNWLSHAGKRILNSKDTGEIQDIREFHQQNWINGLIKEGEEI